MMKKMMILCMIILCIFLMNACNRDSQKTIIAMDSESSTGVVETTETNPEDLLTDVMELPEYAEEGSGNTGSNNSNGKTSVFEEGIEKNNGGESRYFEAQDKELEENNTLQALADVPELND